MTGQAPFPLYSISIIPWKEIRDKEEFSMTNSVLQAIDQRRSIRSYTDEQVSQEHLDLLLSAALSSPSARNSQPWHFTVVQNKALIEKINRTAVEQLKKGADGAWLASLNQPGFTLFHGAPTVIFISAKSENRFAIVDCGIAVQTIALAAHSLGLGSVILGMPRAAFEGPEKEALEKELEFPEGSSFQIAIATGHPAAGKEKHPVEQGKVTILT
jgi:nitroreductase